VIFSLCLCSSVLPAVQSASPESSAKSLPMFIARRPFCFIFYLKNPAFYWFSFLHCLLTTIIQFCSLPSVSTRYLTQRFTLSSSPIPFALHYLPYTSPPLASLTQRLCAPIPIPSVCLCLYSYHCISPSLNLPTLCKHDNRRSAWRI
jgi:hypothetical protein